MKALKITIETNCENSKRIMSYIERKVNLSKSIDAILKDINELLTKHKYNDFIVIGRGGSHIWLSNKVTQNRLAIIN